MANDKTRSPLLTQEAEGWRARSEELQGYLIDIADELCCDRAGPVVVAAVKRLLKERDEALIELSQAISSGSGSEQELPDVPDNFPPEAVIAAMARLAATGSKA